MLAIGDDELNVGDNNDASSEVAGGVGRHRGSHVDVLGKKGHKGRTREVLACGLNTWN